MVLVSICAVITLFDPRLYNVSGYSMFPTLNHRDTVITVSLFMGSPTLIERGNIVCINQEENLYLVKRVVGIPGDRIVVTKGILFINGVSEEAGKVLIQFTNGEYDIELGPNQYFVLGDNRPMSRDSRTFGPVSRERIVGEVIFRWTPLTVPQ
ncbi:MAG: signal peptidase I [Promethearchaeota archaeon]